MPGSSSTCLQWEVLKDVEIDTGANPSAEGGDEDGGGGEARRVVDLVEFFKLNVRSLTMRLHCRAFALTGRPPLAFLQ